VYHTLACPAVGLEGEAGLTATGEAARGVDTQHLTPAITHTALIHIYAGENSHVNIIFLYM